MKLLQTISRSNFTQPQISVTKSNPNLTIFRYSAWNQTKWADKSKSFRALTLEVPMIYHQWLTMSVFILRGGGGGGWYSSKLSDQWNLWWGMTPFQAQSHAICHQWNVCRNEKLSLESRLLNCCPSPRFIPCGLPVCACGGSYCRSFERHFVAIAVPARRQLDRKGTML